MGSLFVTAGPNKGELFPIAIARATVGRDPSCSFQLTDGQISRQHFQLLSEPGSPQAPCTIVDLGSANGTLVNGQRLTGPRPLLDGDTIAIGTTVLRFASRNLSASPGMDNMRHIPRQSEQFRQTVTPP